MVLLLQLLAELIHDLQRRYFPHHLDDAEAAEPPTPEVHRILGQAAKDVLQVRRNFHACWEHKCLSTHKTTWHLTLLAVHSLSQPAKVCAALHRT